MGKSVIGAVAGEMWEPAFGAGFQAPRANQDSQVSCSFQPHWARHFHGKAANFAHFLRNRVFDLPEGLKSSFSRKPPKMHPSSDSCAEPSFPFTNRVRVCFTQNYRNEAILVNGPTTDRPNLHSARATDSPSCPADHSKLLWLGRKQGRVNGSRGPLTAIERLNPRIITAQAPYSVMCLVSIN